MEPLSRRIQERIDAMGRGAVFAATDFLDLGARAAVDQTLSRLARRKSIRRLSRGLYDYPITNSRLGIEVSPDPEKIVQSLARKTGGRIQSSGSQAANQLGLASQVPARIVYHTDGASQRVTIGGQTIELKKVSPRKMALAGRKSGMVIEALKYLGQDHVNEEIMTHLRTLLSDKVKKELLNALAFAPTWMHSIIKSIAGREES